MKNPSLPGECCGGCSGDRPRPCGLAVLRRADLGGRIGSVLWLSASTPGKASPSLRFCFYGRFLPFVDLLRFWYLLWRSAVCLFSNLTLGGAPLGKHRWKGFAPPDFPVLADYLQILPAFMPSFGIFFEKSTAFLKISLFKRQKMVYNKKTEQTQRRVG